MSSELGVERPTTLPLPEPQEERRVHFGDVNSACLVSNERTQTSTPCSRDAEFRPKRIRSASFSAPGECRFYGNKRRKRHRVLPSKFLLGGNITDPLNLGSLDREEASQLGLVEAGPGVVITKKSDAVRVIIPPNINDPLNLDVSSDNEDSLNDALQRQLRKRRRSRKRKRRLSEPSGETVDIESARGESFEECPIINNKAQPNTIVAEILPKISVDTLKPLTINTELPAPSAITDEQRDSVGPVTPVGVKPSTSGFQRPAFKKQRSKCDNKIVSPVIPQPGVERKRHPSHSRQHAEKPHLSQENLKLPKKFNPKNELFQYGNYNKYYGYRNPDMTPDVRLDYLKCEWFDGKEILDIGCNIGHITLTVARDFNPKRVVGIDIDKKLVNIAQKNIKHYLKKGDVQEANFPKSMRLLYGPLKPPVTADGTRHFPHNIKFIHGNYVLESDELLETVRPEFDVIMCLSITKWIHLNWGDAGLKRFFRRIFYNLNPGGRLILEPQGWPSYNKRRKLTLRIFENYKNIRLFPDKFNDYLLHEVGFSTSEKMITPHHTSRGFQRPIIVYTKAGFPTKSSSLEDNHSRDFSTKRGNTSKQFSSSAESEMHDVSKGIKIAQMETEKLVKTVDRVDNSSVTPPSNKLEKVNLTADRGANGSVNPPSDNSEKVNLTDKVENSSVNTPASKTEKVNFTTDKDENSVNTPADKSEKVKFTTDKGENGSVNTPADKSEKLNVTSDKGENSSVNTPASKSEKVNFTSDKGENGSVNPPSDKSEKVNFTTDKGENGSVNPPSNKSEKVNFDHAQATVHTEESSHSKNDKINVDAMDCVSDSQCTDKMEVEERQGLVIKRQSDKMEVEERQGLVIKRQSDKKEGQGLVIKRQSDKNEGQGLVIKRQSDKKEGQGLVIKRQSDKKEGQGLASTRESDVNVCDNVNTRKLSGDGGGSCLTHSLTHKPNQCVVKSASCSSQSENLSARKNSNSSELCTKIESLTAHTSPITKSDNDITEDVCQDQQNLQSVDGSGRERTSLVSSDDASDCLSTTKENPCGMEQDTVCEKSKPVLEKMEDAKN